MLELTWTLISNQVECSDKDLHSGVYGGSVHEAMTDLIALMGKKKQVSLNTSKVGVRAIKAWVGLQWGGVPKGYFH